MLQNLSRNFKQRLLFGSLGTILLVAAVYYSCCGPFKLLFTTLCAAIIGIALWEFYHIAKAKGCHPLNKIGISCSVAYVFAVYISTQIASASVLPLIVLGITLIIAFLYYFFKGTDPFVNLSVTFFGLLYLTVTLSCVIYINYFFSPDSTQDGRWWLFYLLATTKMTDVGAYFCGKSFGKHHLAPYISPKKTWEGTIGGFVAALATSVLLYWSAQHFFTLPPLDLTFFQSLWLGLLISLFAQIGDLSESLLKRDLGVKDSNQLPGLGGFLDIVDSLVFTVPLLYFFLRVTSPY